MPDDDYFCRHGTPDPLMEMSPWLNASLPEFKKLKVRVYSAWAAIALRNCKRCQTLDDAYQQVATHLSWVADDPVWREILGVVPTAGAVRRWCERHGNDARFGHLYHICEEKLPTGLTPETLAEWLLETIAKPTGEAFGP